ncbi:hypothetical protein SAMN02745166_01364 [Prosthecobacter debontii]|uniref:Uncharacterized protein n=1 Tax=Prosthecobacter debontii TaxID=48467 RepID=A0A1T4XBU5_9BACT|nr:hypothetical protein [Prosthecobacter debontii]SKA86867.1 hypothetical protein SAMN02745166_01364 [Prosthecobacter debontii]
MKALSKRHSIGLLLVIVSSLAIAFYWTGVVPWIRGQSPEFATHLSPTGFWQSKQTHLKWGPWWHEDGTIVGAFGDKAWLERMMEWVADGTDLESCQSGHRDSSLAMITNHDPTEATSSDAWRQHWIQWWQANRDKSQEEWIQAGFREQGFEISLPPTEADWPALLQILGATAGPSPIPHRSAPDVLHPAHLRFNAYRWLRDSGFAPIQYLFDQPDLAFRPEIAAGVSGYANFEKGSREFFAPAPGRMAFAPEWTTGLLGHSRPPWLIMPSTQMLVGIILGAGLYAGCYLALHCRHRGSHQQKTPADAGV